MIIVVDDRSLVADAYKATFGRQGVNVSGFSFDEFRGWVSAASEEDVGAIEAVLLAECDLAVVLAKIVKRRCAAAIIAMKEEKSLESTLDLFAGGIDDVVAKPCHAREILARIEAISRRTRSYEARRELYESIRIFGDGRDAIVGAAPLNMPRRELRILEYLVRSSPRRVTKSQIFSAVYGLFEQDIDEKVVESHISKLRRRLRQRLGYDPIDSQRHLGYQLVTK